jgi:glycosyltransferase involved in cell wall biosynthesis
MPAFNSSNFIAKAIESILNQTFQDFELILVDDGSTDNTLEIMTHYREQDNRIQIIQSKHVGCSRARNLGINQSKFPWIAVMDADDIALPKRFAKQIEAANANPKVVAWGTYVHHVNLKEEVLSLQKHGLLTEEEFYDNMKRGDVPFVIHPTSLIKKEILLKVGGYDPKFSDADDFELFDRLSDYGPILVIPEPLLLYRLHSQSVSMNKYFIRDLLIKYVYTRRSAQIKGEEVVDLDQFIGNYKQRPFLLRTKHYLNNLSQFWYRKAGVFFSEKQYLQATLYLSMVIVLNPLYAIPRIWRQRLSPEARRTLNPAK